MNFNIDFIIPESGLEFSHQSAFTLLGSCFSDEMEDNFKLEGFDVLSNPFGTLFHPTALCRNLNNLFESSESPIISRKDLFFNLDFSGTIFSFSKDELKSKTEAIYSQTFDKIKETDCLIVTFGTAWGYRHVERDIIVGNCHKIQQEKFVKELSSVSEMKEEWEKLIQLLKSVNPDLKIIFTVSPVRHIKDGLVQNNRSKARLLQLCEVLERNKDCFYFPSYEIVIDELRDYRFYKKDRFHPNKDSIDYVWERFKDYCFSNKSKKIANKVKGLNQSVKHKSIHPGSIEDQERLVKLKEKRRLVSEEFPLVKWFY